MWQAGISLAAREFPGGSLGKKLAALPPKIARSPTPPGMQVTFHKIPYQATAPPQSWASNTQDLYPRAVTCSTNKPHIRSQIKTWPDATHLLVNSFSICSYCRAANCFRARVHCSSCLFIVFSANPVSCYKRGVVPQLGCLSPITSLHFITYHCHLENEFNIPFLWHHLPSTTTCTGLVPQGDHFLHSPYKKSHE